MYVYGACLFYVCCSDCVGVCGNVCCVAVVVKVNVFFILGVCCMFVSCMHPVVVLNAAFCMT